MANKPQSEVRINYSFIKLLTGYDLSNRRMPFMTINSINPGPVLWLTGCMHGDEIGGTVIIHEIFKRLRKSLKRGIVNALPLMNPFGFENVSRQISISNEDLNRSFPGNSKGSFAQRIASQIFEKITNSSPALVLDLHNDWNKSIPYVLIDNLPEKNLTKELVGFAKESGFVIIQETEKLQTTLTYNLLLHKIPALTLELGESLIINEKNITFGIDAIWNILNYLGMVEKNIPKYQYPMPEQIIDQVLNYSHAPLCSTSGITRFLKKPGQLVKKGDKIAKVFNAFGKLVETITANEDGIILGLNDYAVAFPGSQVMAFGIFSSK